MGPLTAPLCSGTAFYVREGGEPRRARALMREMVTFTNYTRMNCVRDGTDRTNFLQLLYFVPRLPGAS